MFDHYDSLPIVSRILPRRWRRSMLGLFDLARGADAIADNASLSLHARRLKIAELRESILQLDMRALPVWALVHAHDIRRGLSPEYAMHLLDAFHGDTFKPRYETLAELERYATLSTASLGRGFLAIAREDNADLEASDALCIALQLLNHWRDLAEDARLLDRVYMPQEWLRHYGAGEEALKESVRLDAAWLQVLGRLDTHIAALLARADTLPASIRSRRMRFHVRWLLDMAHRWHHALQGNDVLLRRVSPTRRMALQSAFACL